MIGQVITWYMTPEQLEDYKAKHPIVPTEKTSGATFTNVNIMATNNSRKRGVEASKHRKTVMDKVDKEELNRMYMAGDKLKDIANHFDITIQTLDKYIRKQRKTDLEKWPYRAKKGCK